MEQDQQENIDGVAAVWMYFVVGLGMSVIFIMFYGVLGLVFFSASSTVDSLNNSLPEPDYVFEDTSWGEDSMDVDSFPDKLDFETKQQFPIVDPDDVLIPDTPINPPSFYDNL